MYSGVPISAPTRVNMVSAVSFWRQRLGHAEIDNLRRRLAIHLGDQNVRGFQVAVDDGFLVRVLDSFADVHEQFQPVARVEPVIVAVSRDRNTGHVLHDEVRRALGVEPASNTLAMAGWSIRPKPGARIRSAR